MNSQHIKAMVNSLVHRGPDDHGLYCEGAIGLGHRRLSIIDLTESGRNPIWTADRSMAIIFNGEVYNYRELCVQLQNLGYRFTSETDTEVVLNAIHCWGIDQALRKFIGMFALAVWNARERSLLLARDRAGIKPLFYSKTVDSLLFASELKALDAHPGYQKQLNQQGLSQYFVLGYTLRDVTVLANTFRVPAGNFLRVGVDGSISQHRYWGLDDIRRGTFKGSFDDAVEELEQLAESAFSYRLVSDVPVGVFLSGGIDSTFLSAILKKRLGADLLHITIGFRDARYNEAPVAARVAAELGLRHEVRYLDALDAVNALRRFVETYDEPFGDSSGMPTALLSEVTHDYVKVALSADGGDELFCGYESYPVYANRYCQLRRFPLCLRSMAVKMMSALPYEKMLSWYIARQGVSRNNLRLISTVEKAFELMRAEKLSDLLRIMNEKGWSERKVHKLIETNIQDLFSKSVFASQLVGCDSTNSLNVMDAMMRSDYESFLCDDILTKVDRASMSVSLECRDPFLDHRLTEFAFSLPMTYIYFNGEHKRILKHILRRWISEPILTATKRGFVVPLYDWMRGPWQPLVKEFLSKERIRSVGALDDHVVSTEVERFYRYEGIGAEKLFLLLNFQMWAERWYCT